MIKLKVYITALAFLMLFSALVYWQIDTIKRLLGMSNQPVSRIIGVPIDSFNGVFVYYNGNIRNTFGRNRSASGYNIGLKYQCVEFVKRYYYQHLNHEMPNPWGHARDFFNANLIDGSFNKDRGLTQFSNPSFTMPQENDLLVYAPTDYNSFGHVAIVSKVTSSKVEIIQQNPGTLGKSRQTYNLIRRDGKWFIEGAGIFGWLRKE
jgi:surface antigen